MKQLLLQFEKIMEESTFGKFLYVFATIFFISASLQAQLVIENSFDPAQSGTLCGVAHNEALGEIWVYSCSSNQIEHYNVNGTFINSFPFPMEIANDVDLEIAPENLTLGTTNVLAGDLLVINGESNEADIYALDPNTGNVLGMLTTQFGASHVVGGGYHPIRNTFFLVQDKVLGGANANVIAEIDPITGAVLNSVQISASFILNFGDLDISNTSGNLFLVSSDESTIGEFTPDGNFVQGLDLPSGVTSLTGISLNCENGKAWCSGSNNLYLLNGFDCLILGQEENPFSNISVYPNPSNGNFTIDFGKEHTTVTVQIFNMLGQQIASTSYAAAKTIAEEITTAAGRYFVKVSTPNDGSSTLKLIKY